jgi:hypothetical protein
MNSNGTQENGLTRREFCKRFGAVALGVASAGSLAGCLPAKIGEILSSALSFGDLETGDHITFGSYGGQGISWRVLAVEDGKALVITDDIIDLRAYNEEDEETTWERCSLRQWLNADFYTTVFSASEQAGIAQTKLVNPDNPAYGTEGGPDTTDRVFLLSIGEADRYFSGDDDRIAKINMSEALLEDAAHRVDESFYLGNDCTYAEALDSVNEINGMDGDWWLRSRGGDASLVYVAQVSFVGFVDPGWYGVYDTRGGVRPALWLNL